MRVVHNPCVELETMKIFVFAEGINPNEWTFMRELLCFRLECTGHDNNDDA